jgi:hypothetical protein
MGELADGLQKAAGAFEGAEDDIVLGDRGALEVSAEEQNGGILLAGADRGEDAGALLQVDGMTQDEQVDGTSGEDAVDLVLYLADAHLEAGPLQE